MDDVGTGIAARPRRGARRNGAAASAERGSGGGGVQSLTRALTVLNALARHDDGMTLTEVSRSVDLAPSTAHRLLTTLQQERFVHFDGETSRWLVGVQAFIVGNGFHQARDIGAVARPFLRRLVEETGETANLAVEDEGMAVYLGQVESRQLMRAIAKPGGRVFMHSSALGKALLAAMPGAEVTRILRERGLPAFTPRTIGQPARLLRHLDEVRAQGFGVDDQEYALGLRCIAAAVFDPHGQPAAAVSVSGPTVRVTSERVPELGACLRRVAAEITAELGGRPAVVARGR